MARRLERLKNADISGSSTSLDGLRGSSENGAAMNAIENVGFDGGMPENAYCELQHNGKETDPNTYDYIRPKMRNQLNSKVSGQNSSKQRRRNRTRRYRVVKRVLIFLIMFVAIAAMLLSIMLMLGKLGPKCACRKSNSQSPRIGRVSQGKNASLQTFHLNLSPFYDVMDDIKANMTSFRKQTEFMMTEYEGNREALAVAWIEFHNIENAINAFSNRIDSAIGHLTEITRVNEQQNIAINNDVNAMNSSIVGKVTSKISAPGPVGSKGEKGLKGSPGIKGETGAGGATGDTGIKGDPGYKGLPGDKGLPNVKGSKGIPGEKGSPGLVGGVGDIGSAGIVGNTGPRGIGNFSWCIHKKTSVPLEDLSPGNREAAVTDNTSFKVISATCSTDFGHDHYLDVSTPVGPYLHKYNCICRGVAPSQRKTLADVNCILYYMECPIKPP
ncbi:uncharacterized protein [Acropora muricata]|uniref:uncharacterized protein isoform X2 n=1 Tax=Acropora muricata TaxID=159855 RepID=UPI0034E578CA